MELIDFEYSRGWSEERKEAEWRRYRAECKLRCLEANLDRITPEEFDTLMEQIAAARAELSDAGWNLIRVRAQVAISDSQKEAAQRNMH